MVESVFDPDRNWDNHETTIGHERRVVNTRSLLLAAQQLVARVTLVDADGAILATRMLLTRVATDFCECAGFDDDTLAPTDQRVTVMIARIATVTVAIDW